MVITSTTGNRVAVKSGSRVRIPPTPPEKRGTLLACLFSFSTLYSPFRHGYVPELAGYVSPAQKQDPAAKFHQVPKNIELLVFYSIQSSRSPLQDLFFTIPLQFHYASITYFSCISQQKVLYWSQSSERRWMQMILYKGIDVSDVDELIFGSDESVVYSDR